MDVMQHSDQLEVLVDHPLAHPPGHQGVNTTLTPIAFYVGDLLLKP